MEKNKKTMLMMFVGLAVVIVGLMVYLVLTQFGGGQEKPSETDSVTATLPDGDVPEMSDSKSDIYRGKIPAEVLFEGLAAEKDEDVSLVSSGEGDSDAALSVPNRQEPSGDSAAERVFGQAPSSGGSRSSARSGSSGRGASTPPAAMSAQERLEYDRKRAEMVREVLSGGDAQGDNDDSSGHSERSEESSPNAIDLSAMGISDGIISTLDDEPSEGVEYGLRPFKCMFVRNQKLKSGQRVTLRLLEDCVVDGVRVPANTHLSAMCKIGERLELSVRSLEMNGRIVPLALDAYDIDGLAGIYCPETSTSKGAKQVSVDAISTAGRTFGGLVGDLASTVIRTGASIARSATGELSVSVVSGYEFYLVKSERK